MLLISKEETIISPLVWSPYVSHPSSLCCSNILLPSQNTKQKHNTKEKEKRIGSSIMNPYLLITTLIMLTTFFKTIQKKLCLTNPLHTFFYELSLMDFLHTHRHIIPKNKSFPSSSSTSSLFILITPLILSFLTLTSSQSSQCRTSCGNIPINYPFGIDDGCGSPYYRHILVCASGQLQLRTPSGKYPVRSVSYSDPHILVSDPFMWNCLDGDNFRPTRPFSLDTSTHFSLSPQNDYLFFNCSERHVIIEPKPIFCERFPDRCDSSCDSASYLCRHLPECASALRGGSCCSYYPKATESLRLMLKYCSTYTSVHWKNIGTTPPYDQVPEYGIRVDFDIPVTTSCLRCQDTAKGGGKCGFDTQNQNFLCLCDEGNATTYCKDPNISWHSKKNTGVVAGTVTAVSVAGAVGIGAGVWYLRKLRAKAPVTHGVQSNENRLF